MKLSHIVSASLLGLAAAALVAGGASAATNLNSSRSNAFKVGTAAGTTEADCTKKGGTVTTDKGGVKWCAGISDGAAKGQATEGTVKPKTTDSTSPN